MYYFIRKGKQVSNIKTIRFRILMLILGSICLFSTGVFYSWSILKSPFAFTPAELSANFTISLCAFGIGGLVSGLLSKKISPKIRLIIGAILSGAGFSLSTIATGNLPLLYLSYGIMAGLGIGIIYNSVIGSVNSWFPDRKGFSSGTLLMSFGVSALILGKIASLLFAADSFGWKNKYYLISAFILITSILFAFIVRMPRESDSLPKASKKASSSIADDFSASHMIKRTSFWKLFIFFTLFTAVGSTIIGFAKDFALSLGAKESFAVTVVGLVSVCNGIGRLVSGSIFDRLGLKVAQFTTSAVVIVATTLTLVSTISCAMIPGIIGLCLCGFSYGFSPTVSNAFIASFYGMKSYPTNASIINLVLIPASFMSTLAGSIGDFGIIFALLLSISIVGLIINLTIKNP